MSGKVPDGWSVKPLRDLTSHISRGSAPSYAETVTFIWAVSQKCIRNGKLDLSECRPQQQGRSVKADAFLQAGDICVNSTGTGTLGRVALWKIRQGKYFADTHITILRVDIAKIHPAFLAAFLGMPATNETIYRECVTGSTNQIELSRRALSELMCPVPPLEEQQQIAEVLRSMDEAVSLAQQTIDQHLSLWEVLAEDLIWRPALGDEPHLLPLARWIKKSDYGVNAPLHDEPSGLAVLRMGNIQQGQIDLTNLKWSEIGEEEAAALKLHDGDILFNRTNSRDLVGKVALVRGEPDYLYASYLVRLSLDRYVADPYFFFAAMNSRRGQSIIRTIATPGVSQSNINPTNLKKLLFPSYSIERQREVASVLQSVEEARLNAQSELTCLQVIRTAISSQLLSGHVRVPLAVIPATSKRAAQPAFKRAVFAAEVVHQLHQDERFGSVKHEKIVHLCEVHLGLHQDLGRHAYKEAAGPYDPTARRSIEHIFRQQKWFDATKEDKRIVYRPLEANGGHARYFDRYFGDRRAEVQQIIDLLRPLTTQQCEIIVTLYAVWNDFLIDGRQPGDEEIVDGVLNNWTDSKRCIPEEKWRAALPWMREKRLVPIGHGEKTRVAAT